MAGHRTLDRHGDTPGGCRMRSPLRPRSTLAVTALAVARQNIRMDFQTVAIFPDGRLAVSFLDSSTGPIYHLTEPAQERLGPALAIEL
jgi:hypothetical protein